MGRCCLVVPFPTSGRPVTRNPVDIVFAAMFAAIANDRRQHEVAIQCISGRNIAGNFQVGVCKTITAEGHKWRLRESGLPRVVSVPSWDCSHHRFYHSVGAGAPRGCVPPHWLVI